MLNKSENINYSLEMLKTLTEKIQIKKKSERLTKYISSKGNSNAEYINSPEKWQDWCKGWAFALLPIFANELDIKYTPRVKTYTDNTGKKKKKIYKIWTQGSKFCFASGYTIYDKTSTENLIWTDELKQINFCIQIVEAKPVEPATAERDRYAGEVVFELKRPNKDHTILEIIDTKKVSQDEFVRFLILGE